MFVLSVFNRFKFSKIILSLAIIFSFLLAPYMWALQLPLPLPGQDLLGVLHTVDIKPGDTLANIAQRYDVGFFEMVEANPQINPSHPPIGSIVVVPTQFVLPREAPHQGIVINLASMRLYYFPVGVDYFYTYPIGIGREDWGTPLGELTIIQKIKNPIWYVPKSIYEFRKANGDPVPKMMRSGPDNPLGDYAMRLSKPTFLIHGTNDPASVGLRSSAGCIHLYPEDIKELFAMVPIGTPVFIINQPYVLGWNKGHWYIEAHVPLQEDRAKLANVKQVINMLRNEVSDNAAGINLPNLEDAIKDHTGIPTEVGGLPRPR